MGLGRGEGGEVGCCCGVVLDSGFGLIDGLDWSEGVEMMGADG